MALWVSCSFLFFSCFSFFGSGGRLGGSLWGLWSCGGRVTLLLCGLLCIVLHCSGRICLGAGAGRGGVAVMMACTVLLHDVSLSHTHTHILHRVRIHASCLQFHFPCLSFIFFFAYTCIHTHADIQQDHSSAAHSYYTTTSFLHIGPLPIPIPMPMTMPKPNASTYVHNSNNHHPRLVHRTTQPPSPPAPGEVEEGRGGDHSYSA